MRTHKLRSVRHVFLLKTVKRSFPDVQMSMYSRSHRGARYIPMSSIELVNVGALYDAKPFDLVSYTVDLA